jgi:hypothetical protein
MGAQLDGSLAYDQCSKEGPVQMDYARCPECELPAEVIGRFSLLSTDGPIAHVKTACLAGHVFTPLAEDVAFLNVTLDAPPAIRAGFRR